MASTFSSWPSTIRAPVVRQDNARSSRSPVPGARAGDSLTQGRTNSVHSVMYQAPSGRVLVPNVRRGCEGGCGGRQCRPCTAAPRRQDARSACIPGGTDRHWRPRRWYLAAASLRRRAIPLTPPDVAGQTLPPIMTAVVAAAVCIGRGGRDGDRRSRRRLGQPHAAHGGQVDVVNHDCQPCVLFQHSSDHRSAGLVTR